MGKIRDWLIYRLGGVPIEHHMDRLGALEGQLQNLVCQRGEDLAEEVVAGVETLLAHGVTGPFIDILISDVKRYRAAWPQPEFEGGAFSGPSASTADHHGDGKMPLPFATIKGQKENWCARCKATSPNNLKCGVCDGPITQRPLHG